MLLDYVIDKASKSILEYKEVIEYLKDRKIEEEDVIKYKIGYLENLSFERDIIETEEDKDVLKRSKNLKDFFNKIIFPLYNIRNQVIGLCMREIKEKRYFLFFSTEAKKIGAFFGLMQALPYIKETNRVFVHEGAINAISFANVFPESIASLTSYLSEPQYELLSFLCNKIILVYDNDKAGINGAKKVYFKYKNIDTFFFEEGDSNDYIRFFGKDKFKEFLKRKAPYFFIRG
jgi:DNA primase